MQKFPSKWIKVQNEINAHSGLSKRLQNSCQSCFSYFSFHFFSQNCKIFEDQDLINTQNQISTHRQKHIWKTNKRTRLLIRYLKSTYVPIHSNSIPKYTTRSGSKKYKKRSQKRSHKRTDNSSTTRILTPRFLLTWKKAAE